MKHSIFRASVALVALLGGQAVWAQGAPGSDPIILTDQVSYLALPAPAFQPSGQLEQSGEIIGFTVILRSYAIDLPVRGIASFDTTAVCMLRATLKNQTTTY